MTEKKNGKYNEWTALERIRRGETKAQAGGGVVAYKFGDAGGIGTLGAIDFLVKYCGYVRIVAR